MRLPSYILWRIWKLVGSKSYFLDKHLISIISHKRKLFIDKPLRVYYNLCRCKEKYFNYGEVTGRPTLYIEQPRHINLSGCPLGKVNKDQTLRISEDLADKLIPVSTMTESGNGFRLTVLYWTIDSVWAVDARAHLYSLLWPSWKLLPETSLCTHKF
jgi:hypothetical protein